VRSGEVIKVQKLKRLAVGVGIMVPMLSAGLASRAFAFDYANTFAPVTTELLVAITAAVAAIALPFAVILGVRLALAMYRKFTGRV
jgi:succinate dehydrogenase/fumarate reductase cytochrome b subunit